MCDPHNYGRLRGLEWGFTCLWVMRCSGLGHAAPSLSEGVCTTAAGFAATHTTLSFFCVRCPDPNPDQVFTDSMGCIHRPRKTSPSTHDSRNQRSTLGILPIVPCLWFDMGDPREPVAARPSRPRRRPARSWRSVTSESIELLPLGSMSVDTPF